MRHAEQRTVRDTGQREESALHPTPKSVHATTAAIDLAKEVFELAFADNDARIVDRWRLSRTAFAKTFEHRHRCAS